MIGTAFSVIIRLELAAPGELTPIFIIILIYNTFLNNRNYILKKKFFYYTLF